MNSTRRVSHTIGLVIGWCFIVCPIRSFAAKDSLRFDGLYCCHEGSSAGPVTFCLRFYSDGVVLSALSTSRPRDLSTSFNRHKQRNFHYTVKGNLLHFEEETDTMFFVYSGTIRAGRLTLRVDGYDHATKAATGYVKRNYDFVQTVMQP